MKLRAINAFGISGNRLNHPAPGREGQGKRLQHQAWTAIFLARDFLRLSRDSGDWWSPTREGATDAAELANPRGGRQATPSFSHPRHRTSLVRLNGPDEEMRSRCG
jgi:hypothetical protein